MTIDEVRERVAKVRAVSNDPETAHVREDELYVAVLEAIATGDHPPGYEALLASAALEAVKIEFDRWYA